jgi:hypothetical protein
MRDLHELLAGHAMLLVIPTCGFLTFMEAYSVRPTPGRPISSLASMRSGDSCSQRWPKGDR